MHILLLFAIFVIAPAAGEACRQKRPSAEGSPAPSFGLTLFIGGRLGPARRTRANQSELCCNIFVARERQGILQPFRRVATFKATSSTNL